MSRTLLISYAFAPGVGGIETVGSAIWRELRKQGRCLVITNSIDSEAGNATDADVVCRPGFFHLIRLLFNAQRIIINNPSIRLTWPLLFMVKKNMTMQIHHTPFAHDTKFKTGIFTLVKRYYSSAIGRNYFVSAYLRAVQGLPGAVIYNPVNLPLGQPRDGRRRVEIRILFMGRFTEVKGCDVFVEIVHQLVSLGLRVRAKMIGHGALKTQLQELVSQYGLSNIIEFGQVMSSDQALHIYDWADFVLLPSRIGEGFPAEGLPMVVLEAKTRGAIVLGTRSGGMPEAIGNSGLVLDNVSGFVEAIARISEDSNLKSRLSKLSISDSEKYNIEDYISCWFSPNSRDVIL